MTEKLQIYKDSYLLVKKLYLAMPQMDKYHRHIIGARILDSGLDLFKHISLANQSRDMDKRIMYLENFLSIFEQIKIYLRLCNDIKMLKSSTIVDMQLTISDIAKQINGWIRATSRT